VFFFDQLLDFDHALAAAKEHWPQVFERFDFEVHPVSQDDKPNVRFK